MPIDVTKFDNKGLQNFIDNHRRQNETDRPEYLEALEEQARRKGMGLDFEKSLNAIRQAVAEERYLSYGELAELSGCDWGKVHYAMFSHLFDLVEYAHRRGWPMLSAIIVEKPNVQSGKMSPKTLKGFISAARWLGIPVTDEKAFLREQQQKVFEWGKTQNGE